MATRYWPLVCAGLCTAAFAGQPPQTPSPDTSPAPPPPAADAAADDGFIEFLGADDVGDAAWWEFLKKSAPRKDPPSPAPPPDAKQ